MNRELHPRGLPGADLLDQGRAPADLDFDRHYCRFPRRNPATSIQTMDLLAQVKYDCLFGFKYSGRPNTPASTMTDSHPEARKSSSASSAA
jgi:hypothetical protein